MGFRVGVGGGVGPLRGGVSNRGVGGGVGPVSAGYSFGRKSRSEWSGTEVLVVGLVGLLALAVALVPIVIIAAWPYWLIAALLHNVSGAAPAIVAWLVEAVYVAFLVLVARVLWVKRRRAQAAVVAQMPRMKPTYIDSRYARNEFDR